jgi:hypothetical protein
MKKTTTFTKTEDKVDGSLVTTTHREEESSGSGLFEAWLALVLFLSTGLVFSLSFKYAIGDFYGVQKIQRTELKQL